MAYLLLDNSHCWLLYQSACFCLKAKVPFGQVWFEELIWTKGVQQFNQLEFFVLDQSLTTSILSLLLYLKIHVAILSLMIRYCWRVHSNFLLQMAEPQSTTQRAAHLDSRRQEFCRDRFAWSFQEQDILEYHSMLVFCCHRQNSWTIQSLLVWRYH